MDTDSVQEIGEEVTIIEEISVILGNQELYGQALLNTLTQKFESLKKEIAELKAQKAQSRSQANSIGQTQAPLSPSIYPFLQSYVSSTLSLSVPQSQDVQIQTISQTHRPKAGRNFKRRS